MSSVENEQWATSSQCSTQSPLRRTVRSSLKCHIRFARIVHFLNDAVQLLRRKASFQLQSWCEFASFHRKVLRENGEFLTWRQMHSQARMHVGHVQAGDTGGSPGNRLKEQTPLLLYLRANNAHRATRYRNTLVIPGSCTRCYCKHYHSC